MITRERTGGSETNYLSADGESSNHVVDLANGNTGNFSTGGEDGGYASPGGEERDTALTSNELAAFDAIVRDLGDLALLDGESAGA
jgi:hypothetical protein